MSDCMLFVSRDMFRTKQIKAQLQWMTVPSPKVSRTHTQPWKGISTGFQSVFPFGVCECVRHPPDLLWKKRQGTNAVLWLHVHSPKGKRIWARRVTSSATCTREGIPREQLCSTPGSSDAECVWDNQARVKRRDTWWQGHLPSDSRSFHFQWCSN